MSSAEPLFPIKNFFPGKSARWCAENARAGRVPGAVKVGREWFVRASDLAAGRAAGAPAAPSIEDAVEDLRRRGIK